MASSTAPTGTRVRSVGDGVVEFAGARGGYGNMVILRHRGNLLDQRNFNPAFHVWMLRKDIDFAINAGYQVGSPMPTTALIRQFLNALEATGRGELDCLALALLMEEQAGIKH